MSMHPKRRSMLKTRITIFAATVVAGIFVPLPSAFGIYGKFADNDIEHVHHAPGFSRFGA